MFDLPSLRGIRPRKYGLDSWSDHVPFGYDLVAEFRPKLLVELGTDRGESYFTFCQSVAENDTATSCYAVDTWNGDKQQTGFHDWRPYTEAARHNGEFYGAFSSLVRSTFDEALKQFADGSIDLLHLDGAPTYDAVRHDFDAWLPKVRPGGIILIHKSAARHENFGVWKLWEEVSAEAGAPCFEFRQGWGLGVYRKPGGPRLRSAFLRDLFGSDERSAEAIRRYYALVAENLRLHKENADKEAKLSGTGEPYAGEQPRFQVYFPQDGIYTEASTVVLVADPGRWTKVRVALPAGYRGESLRLDPLCSHGVVDLAQMQITSSLPGDVLWECRTPEQFATLRVGGTAAVVPHPRFLRLFSHGKDPQIFIPPLAFEDVEEPLQMELSMRAWTSAEDIVHHLHGVLKGMEGMPELRAAREAAERQIDALREQLQQTEAALVGERGRLAQAEALAGEQGAHRAAMEGDLARASTERDAARQLADGHAAEAGAAREQLGAMIGELASANAETAAARQQLAESQAARAALEAEKAALDGTLAGLRQELGAAGAEAEALRQRFATMEQTLAENQAARTALEAEKAALDGAVAGLRQELGAAGAEAEALRQRSATMEQTLAENQAARTALEAEKAALDAAVAGLRQELGAAGAEAEALRQRFATMEQTLAENQAARAALEAEKALLEGEKAAVDGAISALREELATANAGAEALRQRLAASEQTLAESQAARAAIEVEKAALDGAISALRQELAAAGADAEVMGQRLAAAEAALADREAALAVHEAALAEAKSQCAALQDERSIFAERISALDVELSAARTAAEDQRRATELRFADASAEAKFLNDENGALREGISASWRALLALDEQIKQMHGESVLRSFELEEARWLLSNARSAQEELAEAGDALQASRHALAEKEAALTDMRERLSASEAALGIMQDRLTASETALKAVRARMSASEAALLEMRDKFEDSSAELTETRDGLANAQAEAAALKMEIRGLRNEVQTAEESLHAIKVELSQARERLELTESDLTQTRSHLEADRGRLASMRQSASWKLTLPLRAVRRSLSGERPTSKNGLAYAPPPTDESAGEEDVQETPLGYHFHIDSPGDWELVEQRAAVRGWCLPPVGGGRITGIRLRAGNREADGRYGLARPDVAGAFGLGDEGQHCGFEVSLELPGGPSQLRLEVLDETGEARLLGEYAARAPYGTGMRRRRSDSDPSTDYTAWIERYDSFSMDDRRRLRAQSRALAYQPLISVLMPVYNTPEKWLVKAIESVRRQLYPHWELCIADDASPNPDVRRVLESYEKAEPRIKVCYRPVNGHISNASNSALDLVTGEFIALLDHDDEFALHALYAVAAELNAHPEADVIYSDEDKIDEQGHRSGAYFKPDWNPDLLTGQNCVSHLGVFRTELVRRVGGFRAGLEGCQDWDLAWRVIEQIPARNIRHIPRVLYHWRTIAGSTALAFEEKDYILAASYRTLKDHCERTGKRTEIFQVPGGQRRLKYLLPADPPLVSIIIPTRNFGHLVKQCVDSVRARTTYPHYEIIVIDNQSDEAATLDYFEELKASGGKVIPYSKPFNYSAINNFAVTHARGEMLCLLNNDIEVITPEWLDEMVSHALRPEIGAVGAMLYYPDDFIQHAGVISGLGGIAGHIFYKVRRGLDGYFNRARLTQNYSAVTAACMVIRKSIFEEVGGLDEDNLTVAFNDVDFCLKVRAAGYNNLWTPFAELYHHESASRGLDTTSDKHRRFVAEVEVMRSRWTALIEHDPAYNPNLTLEYSDCRLASPPRIPSLLWDSTAPAPVNTGMNMEAAVSQ